MVSSTRRTDTPPAWSYICLWEKEEINTGKKKEMGTKKRGNAEGPNPGQ
jgi:hypothetical protein